MKLASVLHCTDNTGNTMNSPINLILDFAIRSTFVFTGVLAIVILSVRLSLGWISQKGASYDRQIFTFGCLEDSSFRNRKAFP